MALVLGFRSKNVGIDTVTYIDYYNSLSIDIFSGYMEIGWNTLSVCCKMLNFSAYSFHFVVALLSLFPYYYVALSYKDTKVTGLVLYFLYSLGFYFLMFNVMRQFLAISILVLGYSSLEKGAVRKFVLFVILACFIHLSSLCAFLMYFINKVILSPRKVFVILLVSFILGIIVNEMFFGMIAGKYVSNVEDYGLRSGLAYTLTVGLLTNLFFLWLFKCEPSLSNSMWVKLNLFSIVILNIMSNLVIGPRIVYVFSVTSVFALAHYVSHNSSNILFKPIIYLYSFVMFIRFLIPEFVSMGTDGSLIPYEMCFQFFDI